MILGFLAGPKISYFEFLITSEFNLGNSLPRLPLWTTHVVNSYIALDSQQGHIKGFGRLSKKHITSTPFKGSKQQMEIPTEIRDYMELKFEGIPLCQEKKRLQSLVSNFFKKMVQNCIPIVKGYVDDIQLVSSSTHKQELEPSFENELHFPAQANKNAIIEESKSEMVVYQQKKKVSEEEMEKFFQNMLFFNQIQVPQDNYDIRSEFHQILHNISERCSLGEQSGGFDLPNLYPEFESSLLYPKGMTSAINVNDTSLQFSEFLKQIKEELSFEIKNQRISYPTMEQDCKFSLQNFEFYLPSEEEPFHGDDDNLHEFFRRPDNILSHNGIIRGWIHPCVMDCYGMLTSTEQIHRRKEGKFGEKEILMHVVIKEVTKLPMDPNLDCSDPEYKRVLSLDYVGYRLENAGLVHIPCPVGKEWILIVANFIDKSFDVLNPDSAEEKFSS
nr:uncharacterized protein LOC127334748 [Lolium perenne]